MPTPLPRSAVLYRAQLGPAALARGERVVCQWLAWAGADATLARVRIVSSTAVGLACGPPRPERASGRVAWYDADYWLRGVRRGHPRLVGSRQVLA